MLSGFKYHFSPGKVIYEDSNQCAGVKYGGEQMMVLD